MVGPLRGPSIDAGAGPSAVIAPPMMSARRAIVGALVLLLARRRPRRRRLREVDRPVADADEALAAGDRDRARAVVHRRRGAVRSRCPSSASSSRATTRAPSPRSSGSTTGCERYDAVIEKAQHAPDAAVAALLGRPRVLREEPRRREARRAVRLADPRRRGAASRRRSGAGRLGHEIRLRTGHPARLRAAQAAQGPAEPADAAPAPAAARHARPGRHVG